MYYQLHKVTSREHKASSTDTTNDSSKSFPKNVLSKLPWRCASLKPQMSVQTPSYKFPTIKIKSSRTLNLLCVSHCTVSFSVQCPEDFNLLPPQIKWHKVTAKWSIMSTLLCTSEGEITWPALLLHLISCHAVWAKNFWWPECSLSQYEHKNERQSAKASYF